MTRVIGAIAAGDLTKRMELEIDGRPLKGAYLRKALLVNSMVDQLASFSGEVSRVAREVGTEGKLGGQALFAGSGTWRDLTESVNLMASNLTAQVRDIAKVTTAVSNEASGKGSWPAVALMISTSRPDPAARLRNRRAMCGSGSISVSRVTDGG